MLFFLSKSKSNIPLKNQVEPFSQVEQGQSPNVVYLKLSVPLSNSSTHSVQFNLLAGRGSVCKFHYEHVLQIC